MIGLVLIAHGQLAEEFCKAVNHVLGPQTQIEAINIQPEDDIEQRRRELMDAVERVDSGAGVIVLSDMFGGTPSNLAISLLNRPNVEVVAGVNLPMLVKLVTLRTTEPINELILAAQEAGRKYISVASKLIAANE